MGELSRVRKRAWPVWVFPVLLTLTITLTGIGRAQLWRDELATWSAATRSIGDLGRLAGTIDAASGPYYLLMHGWVALAGDSTIALRLPSALALTGAAGLTAVLGARLVGRRAGLLAGLLFAVLPSTSRYGQEARPYALATLLAVAATLLLVTALDAPGPHQPGPSHAEPRPGRSTRGRAGLRCWVAYTFVVAALGLVHLVALTLLAAHAVWVLGHGPGGAAQRARRLGRWVLAVLPAVLVVGPLAVLAQGQRGRQLHWVDAARPADLATLAGGVAQSGMVGGLLVGLAALGAAGLGAAGLGRRALLPGCAVLLPVAVLFAAGTVVPLWVPRYLVFVVPFACVLAGAALAGATLAAAPLWPALAVVGLAGLLGLPDQAALRRTHEWPRSATVDYRGAARVVADGRQPGDAIVYSPRDSWLFLDLGLAYHRGDRLPRDALATEDPVRRGDLWAAECDQPAVCLAGVDRVWLVVAGRRSDTVAAVPGGKGDALRTRFRVAQVHQRPGLTVALLRRH